MTRTNCCLPFLFAASMMALNQGCNDPRLDSVQNPTATIKSPASFGDVIHYNVIDRADGLSGQRDLTIVSGDATVENQEFLNTIRDSALKVFPGGRWMAYGPDAAYREIRLVCENGTIELDSWHPIAESNPRVVASSSGLTLLGDQTRDEFLKNDDPRYLVQRKAFDEIQQQLVSHFRPPGDGASQDRKPSTK